MRGTSPLLAEMVSLNKGRNDMHIHNFKEVTDYFHGDDFLHVFECECGFTIAEKKRLVKTGSGQKKMTVYTVMRKREKKE